MSRPLNLVFCGTPLFAVDTLERLVASGFVIRLVVTQPDRAKGRGLEFVSSPVKQSAAKLGLPITQPETIKNNADFRSQLSDLKPDAIVVVGYGRIVPQWMLDLPLSEISTCMLHCCQSIAARRRFNGRLRGARESRALRR